jgi:hypothetical protein
VIAKQRPRPNVMLVANPSLTSHRGAVQSAQRGLVL